MNFPATARNPRNQKNNLEVYPFPAHLRLQSQKGDDLTVKTKKTNSEKRPDEAKFSFPCGDFKKLAEMMKNCCPDEGGTFDCCSMMRKMMERGRKSGAKKAGEAQKTSEGGENA